MHSQTVALHKKKNTARGEIVIEHWPLQIISIFSTYPDRRAEFQNTKKYNEVNTFHSMTDIHLRNIIKSSI